MDREACWHRFILFIPLSKEISHRFDSIIISFTKVLWHFLSFRDYNIHMEREEVEHSFVTRRQPWNDTPWATSGKWKLGERQSAYMQPMIIQNSWEWGAAPQRSWQQPGPASQVVGAWTRLYFCFLSSWVQRNKMKGSETGWLEFQGSLVLSSFMWTLRTLISFYFFHHYLPRLPCDVKWLDSEWRVRININQWILLEWHLLSRIVMYFNSFIEVSLTNEIRIHLRYTTWPFEICTHC